MTSNACVLHPAVKTPHDRVVLLAPVAPFRGGIARHSTALAEAFEEVIASAACVPLPLSLAHAEAAGKLDLSHRDPFDRLLIAQALTENVPIVSNEKLFDAFGVERVW